MKNTETLKNDLITPKKLCDLGVCISLSQGRRIIACLPEIKLKKIIKEAEKNKKDEN